MKRPAAADSEQRVAKKPAVDPVVLRRSKCAELSAALSGAPASPEFSSSVWSMLSNIVSDSLLVDKPERHDYQQQAVEMLGGGLDALRASLQKDVDDSEAKLQECKDKQAEMDAAKESAAKSLEE